MILSNARVMCGDFVLRECDVRIEGDRIAQIGELLVGDVKIDLSGKYLLPGFIDTHIHGAGGSRFDDAESDICGILRFESTQGVTSLAATVAGSVESIISQCRRIREFLSFAGGARIAAIHSEGPFISLSRKGAMNPGSITAPDVDKLESIIGAAGGLLKIISLAPEVDGAFELIKYAVSRGIAVSMGHTDATYGVAIDAIGLGASRMTHTFNAARPINHREPGVLGAALADDRVVCEVICDFIHLHPATVKLIYAAKGADLINVISDSSAAAGCRLDEFEVGGVKRYVKNGAIYLADGTIAGSACTVLDGVKNLASIGIPLGDISNSASLSPARSLGLDSELGSIEEGKLADLVVLDGGLNVFATFVGGNCVYKRI